MLIQTILYRCINEWKGLKMKNHYGCVLLFYFMTLWNTGNMRVSKYHLLNVQIIKAKRPFLKIFH